AARLRSAARTPAWLRFLGLLLAIGAAVVSTAATPEATRSGSSRLSRQQPFAFDSAPGRLPKNVIPLSYQIAIVPDLTALTFDGTESVQLRFRSASARIELDTLNQTLSDVRLDGEPVAAVDTDQAQQLTTLTLAHPAPSGLHRLTLRYHGRIETQPQGLYLQHYAYPGGPSGVILSTKMEA